MLLTTNIVYTLVYRNMTAAIDRLFVLWQVVYPIVHIFGFGYSFSSLIGGGAPVQVGQIFVSYPAFLAAGTIGFSMMWASVTAGTIIWSDRRNGMLDQLLVMPIRRFQYLLGNLFTIMIIGLLSALIVIVGAFTILIPNIDLTITGMAYFFAAVISGSLFFGSLVICLSVRLSSSPLANTVETGLVNGVFVFFSLASSQNYPTQLLPLPLQILFYSNPLTYVADIMRAGLFTQINSWVNAELGIIVGSSIIIFFIAARSMAKAEV